MTLKGVIEYTPEWGQEKYSGQLEEGTGKKPMKKGESDEAGGAGH